MKTINILLDNDILYGKCYFYVLNPRQRIQLSFPGYPIQIYSLIYSFNIEHWYKFKKMAEYFKFYNVPFFDIIGES